MGFLRNRHVGRFTSPPGRKNDYDNVHMRDRVLSIFDEKRHDEERHECGPSRKRRYGAPSRAA